MKVLKTRRVRLLVIASVLYLFLQIASATNPLPDGDNYSRTVNYPVMIYVHSSLDDLVVTAILVLLIWWLVDLIRSTRLLVTIIMLSIAVLLASAAFCIFCLLLLTSYSPIQQIDSIHAGDYVYQLIFADASEPDRWYEISTPARWIIYRCDSSGIWCRPIYQSERFYHDIGGSPMDLGSTLTFDPATDQITLLTNEPMMGTDTIVTLDHASSTDPISSHTGMHPDSFP